MAAGIWRASGRKKRFCTLSTEMGVSMSLEEGNRDVEIPVAI